MNQYRGNSTAWQQSAQGPQGSTLWSGVTHFFRRQPEFVLGSALLGGALLAFLIKNRATTVEYEEERRQPWQPAHEPRWRTPAARMGATEEQMEEVVTPSARALEAGTAGVTGAAYDLDPTSITSG